MLEEVVGESREVRFRRSGRVAQEIREARLQQIACFRAEQSPWA